jgi:pimeloyl-ACP methyl ester carboxylesterase
MTARLAGAAGSLAIDDGGRGGVPVVLLHSLAGNSGQWARVLDRLRAGRRALALDLRGHGQSEAPANADYSFGAMAGDVGSVVDSLGLERFVLVGHSMGAGVALVYAGAHPERVAGLLLLDPIGDGTRIPAAEWQSFLGNLERSYDSVIQGYWGQIAGSNPAVRERLLADLRATPRAAVTNGLRQVMQFDPQPALARYQGPMLSIVTPANDQEFSLHRVGKGFPHRIVEGTGHWIQLDKPDVFYQILDDFLQTVSGKRKKRER